MTTGSPDATPLAITARGLRKGYRDRQALSDVDLDVRAGALHGLLGPNGAGKTTLMRIMLGLIRADAGTVSFLGQPMSSARRAVPDGVAGFAETPAFYPYLTGRANLALCARLDGVRTRDAGPRVARALDDVGLSGQANQAFGAYSAGMRQRLGLAAALLRTPRVLLLDEPTSALDPASARDVRAVIRRLASGGVAVLFSSHDMAEVEELCDQLTVLDRGRVVYDGTTEALQRHAPAAVYRLETSDHRAAMEIACRVPQLRATPVAPGGAVELSGDVATIDAFVIALGRAGVAVRALDRRTRSLESLFLELTGGGASTASAEPAKADAAPGRRRLWAAS